MHSPHGHTVHIECDSVFQVCLAHESARKLTFEDILSLITFAEMTLLKILFICLAHFFC